MPKSSTAVIDELLPRSYVTLMNGERVRIERLPLRKIFRLMQIVESSFGDLLDLLSPNLPAELIARLTEIEDPAEVTRRIQLHMASQDRSLRGIMVRVLAEQAAVAEIVALALPADYDGEWVLDNLSLSSCVEAITCVIESELNPDFFGSLVGLRETWMTARKRLTVEETDEISEPPLRMVPNPIPGAGSGA